MGGIGDGVGQNEHIYKNSINRAGERCGGFCHHGRQYRAVGEHGGVFDGDRTIPVQKNTRNRNKYFIVYMLCKRAV
jgi:hypothetical protein